MDSAYVPPKGRPEPLDRALAWAMARGINQPHENPRTASAVFWMSLFCAALSLFYAFAFMGYDADKLRVPIFAAFIGFAIQLGGALLTHFQHQLLAANVVLATGFLQVSIAIAHVGPATGVHLYLISVGLVVFMVFTDEQKRHRWFFVGLAAVLFVVYQFAFPATAAPVPLPAALRSVLMSFSSVVTACFVYLLAAISYYRAGQTRLHVSARAERAAHLANTDALTGLPNRRPLIDALRTNSAPGVGDFVVAMADLDDFKALNDTWGHTCGDVVLEDVAILVHNAVREGDIVGRWGGEEFMFVFPRTPLEEAEVLLEFIRAAIQHSVFDCGSHEHEVTISIGLTDGHAGEDPLSVVKRADDALYDAKVAGRNTVMMRTHGAPDQAAPTYPEVERRVQARRASDRLPDAPVA